MYKTILYLNILLVQKGKISVFLIVVFPLCLLRLPLYEYSICGAVQRGLALYLLVAVHSERAAAEKWSVA